MRDPQVADLLRNAGGALAQLGENPLLVRMMRDVGELQEIIHRGTDHVVVRLLALLELTDLPLERSQEGDHVTMLLAQSADRFRHDKILRRKRSAPSSDRLPS